MGTLRHSVPPAVAGTVLLFCLVQLPAQIPGEPTDLDRRFARHFPERAPAQLEFAEAAEHRPLVIITNSYQFSMTAYVVQTEPKSADDNSQTLIHDALTRIGGLFAPIPKGLSHKIGIPHVEGAPMPDAKLVAAVWEDGSTFGSDELLARISNSRKALAESYDRAIAILRNGLDKNWTAEEYLTAALQLKPPTLSRMATVEEAQAVSQKFIVQGIPSRTITDNIQHAVQQDRSPARVAKLAQILLRQFEESRDSLRKALSGPFPSTDQPMNK
ncbi:MAG: hypothetical protein DMG36_04350 [Acidobacteria bacterium]|nr:MAG: hypothetical protein DMG36_04350 [Acidobacteriota bacterium]